ncbi:MAG: Uma2 family endonuclease [Anaerolineae bacterium]|nr:Uma2 family endonuclease [Anaerolineae bacterium]
MADITQTRMTLDEFKTLPESMDHIELIDGELIMSPAPKYKHQKAVLSTAAKLLQLPQGTTVVSPMDVYLDENVLQPDVFWVNEADSLCKLGNDGYWHGAPDLVVEVLSASTARRDHGVKFRLYEQHGTREYWLVDAEGEFVEVFHRENDMLARAGVYGTDESFALSILPDVIIQVAALFG